jgi:glycosyltransferase involved in cell wall biosynthesis
MANYNPLISVVIPTYNHAAFLKEAIDSVLSQTYSNYEIVIVNNFSEDNTIEVVEGYQNPSIHLYNFSNNGVIAASRNYGIKQAKGEFIALLDSDDIWLPQKLEKQLAMFNKYSELLLVSTNMSTFPGGKHNYLKLKHDTNLSFKKLLVSKENPVLNSSVMIKKNVIDYVGLLDENSGIRAVEDYDYWLRILRYKDNSGLIIMEDLLKYRMHHSNISNYSSDYTVLYEKLKIVLSKHIDYDQPFIEKIIIKRKKEAIKRNHKYAFYNRKTGLIDLFKLNEINLFDKFEILFKYIILKLNNLFKNH